MKYTTILEKLGYIYNIISKNIAYPIFLGLLAIIILLMITKIIKNKKGIILIIVSYITLFTITIINNSKSLGKVFDNISTNFFTNIYFPSAYTYFFVLIVVAIITIKSLLNFKERKSNKIINSICFLIIQFLFVLIMDVIGHNNIDIFAKKSLFKSKYLVILLESSINTFILWLVLLLGIYLTNKIAEIITVKNTNKELVSAPITDINNTLVVETPKEEEILSTIPETNNNIIENNIYNTIPNNNITINNKPSTNELKDTFSLNDLIFTSNNTIINEEPEVTNSNDNLLDKFLNNNIPLIQEVEEPKLEEKIEYTLNDYKIFNKILKDIRNINNSNVISIDKELENKLINKYPEDEYNLFKVMLKEYSH